MSKSRTAVLSNGRVAAEIAAFCRAEAELDWLVENGILSPEARQAAMEHEVERIDAAVQLGLQVARQAVERSRSRIAAVA